VLRTLPNDESKISKSYTNPPFLTETAAIYLRSVLHTNHLLVDLPSVDREDDQGLLACHRIFWSKDGALNKSSSYTITELCYVPNYLNDGIFMLNLGIAPLELDAAPSRPLLYPLTEKHEQ
jgi:hypothetical protein